MKGKQIEQVRSEKLNGEGKRKRKGIISFLEKEAWLTMDNRKSINKS